jgi:selenocysteine lyase/cysteine desulfurase
MIHNQLKLIYQGHQAQTRRLLTRVKIGFNNFFDHGLNILSMRQRRMDALVTSRRLMVSEGQWASEHQWPGAIDWSGYLCVEAAFQFIERCGGADEIRKYCHTLAVEGGEAAANILRTEVLEKSGTEYIANMVNVRLPLNVSNSVDGIAKQKRALLDRLFEKNCFLNPYVMTREGKPEWWCRFSAQIYLEVDDFKRGAEFLEEICSGMQGMYL